MIWELRFARDGFSVEAARRKGRPLPDWYLDEPPIEPADLVFLDGFWRLSTTRRIQGGNIGWDMIARYASRVGFDHEMTNAFERIVWFLDNAFLDWNKKNAKPEEGERRSRRGTGDKRRSRGRRT